MNLFKSKTKMTSIYVGNLPFTATEDDVRKYFEPFGAVSKVKLISDRETGRPRGFGFVEMEPSAAQAAIAALNGKDLGGRTLRVNEAQERAPRAGGGGGGGGMGGGAPRGPPPSSMLDFALVAHRGHAARVPENTLPALDAAAAAGIDHLEFDIQLSADGIPIVLHDATLDRTAARSGDARQLDWAELRHIPVGEPARFGAAFSRVCIPSVAEVAAFAAAQPRLHLFPEIKAESLELHGHARMLPAVLAALAPVLDRCTVISFDREALAMARAAGARIGWCLPDASSVTQAALAALAPEVVFADADDFPGAAALWPGRWRWAFYEVTTLAAARALAARGAAFIESKRAPELLSELRAGA